MGLLAYKNALEKTLDTPTLSKNVYSEAMQIQLPEIIKKIKFEGGEMQEDSVSQNIYSNLGRAKDE